MYENSDTTNVSYKFDKNDTNYVKYLPLGATIFAAGKAYVLLGMNMCILQNNSPTRTSNNTTSHCAEQVVEYTVTVNLEVNLENQIEHRVTPQLA